MSRRKVLIVGGILLVFIIAAATTFVLNKETDEPDINSTNNQSIQQPEANEPEPSPAPQPPEPEQPEELPTYDTTTPSSLTFIANKTHPLPADYVPAGLITPDVRLRLSPGAEQMQFRSTAHGELKEMFAAAKADGVTLVFGSGYRSYSLQKQFYDSYVARDGQAAADRYSARPGTSEHQTGLAFDVTSPSQTCHLEICFENTTEGKWMAKHAHKYGFVLRYPNGKETVTGYQYEPWHFRFVGKELAAKIHAQSTTLEEFFDI